MRFLLEGMGPELHQYLVENDTDGRPFDRDTRSVIYERAKNVGDKKPFGTEHDVYDAGYSWLNHSIAPRPMVADPEADLRVIIGGDAVHPALLGVGAQHLRDELRRARRGRGPRHEPGRQGGWTSPTTPVRAGCRATTEAGGDLIWQIGTGYFGCRDANGDFDPEAFRTNATLPAGQDDRDQGLPGRQARPRRHPARRQGDRGDRRGPARARRARTCSRRPTTRRSRRRWRCARSSPSCASCQRRQAGRLQDLHR